MKKRTSKLLSLLLTLAMVLGMLPAMSMTAAAYTEGDIEGTTGTGTVEDPVVCDTFDEFKAAMENTEIICVKLNGVSGSNGDMPSQASLAAAISNTTYKVLTIEGTNTFTSPLNGMNDCLIWPRNDLTINGTGTLKYVHGNTGGTGAVINMASDNLLAINGNVTLEGGANGTSFGYAIFAQAGTTKINGGSFIGYNAFIANNADMFAVIISRSANLTINGGNFSASLHPSSPEGKKAHSLCITSTSTGTISIKAGTFSQGIDIEATGKTIETCGYFNEAKEISVNGSVIAASESTEALRGQNVEVSNIASIRNLSATVTKPADGASPVFSATAGDDSYTVTVNEWYNGGTADTPNIPNTMSASDTFIAGNPYVVEVIFTPKEGYLIRSDRSVTINGLDAYFCGSQSSTGAVYYRAAFTATAKKYSGTGSYNDPAVCTNFEAFKQAMENPSIQYVKLVGDSTPGFYKKDTIPVTEDGVLRDAVLCDGRNKVLILEGNTKFEGPPTCNSLINLSVNNRLTITGNGTLAYCPHYFHRESAVVNLEGDSAKLTVEDGVRLRGFAEVGNTHGRAIYAKSNSTVIINGGILYGEDALTTNADEIFTSAVTITGHANLIVNGGYISTTREEDKQCESALYLDTTGQVILREGEILEAGIVVVPNTLTINGSAYFVGSRVYTKSGSEWVEQSDRAQPVSILEGTNVKMSFTQFIDAATVTVTDPMSGQAPNTTSFTVGGSTYTVDQITWYNGGTVDNPGTKMTSSDTFEAGQTYIVDVYVKPTKDSGYVIRNGCTVTINGVPTDKAFYRDGITGAGNYRVALTCNKSLITSLSATGLPTLPAAGTKGEGVVNVPLTVTDPGYTATFTGWLRKTTLGDRQGYSVMTASNTFEAGETYFAEVMIVPVDGNLISTNATATVDGNTAVYTSGTVDGKRSYVVPFTVPNEAEETAYNITCVNCRVLNDKTTATAGTKLTFVSPSDTYGDGGVLSKWVVTVGDGEPTVVDGATQFALQYVMPGADLKMEAVYSKAVTFMDGENTIVKKTVDTTTNKVTSWPTNPTKEGYQFIGWYTKANGGIQKSKDAEFEANTTLYAHWDKVISTVKITEVTLPRVGVELSAAGAKSETAGIEVDSAKGVWYYSTDDGVTWTAVTGTLEANASNKYKFEVPFSIKDGYFLSASAGCSISYSKASIRSNGVRKYIATLECEASPASVTYIQFSGGYSIDGELKNESPIGGVPEDTNVTLTPTDLDICRENGLTDILNLLKGKHFAGWKSWDGTGYYVVDLTKNADGSVSFTMPTAAAQAGYSGGICIAEIWEDHSGGTATCTYQAICEDCGEAYGELAPDNHSGANVWEITATTHKAFCQDCGKAKMAAAEDHDFGGDNICDTCGYDCSEKTYTVTVIDGSATPASATAGTTVTLTADEPADGMKFKEWVVVSGSVTINSDNTFTMPESNVVIMASYVPKVVIPGTFAVTVNGSYASATGAGAYAPDEVVSIHAGTRSNYTFAGWTSSDVTIAGASNADASFIMPYNDVTVTANWTYNG
ncbi:MAG: InlB B-repeat-containing protein, partial [Vescimonas sp.]